MLARTSRLGLTSADVAAVAALARVPDENLARFDRALREAVERAWASFALAKLVIGSSVYTGRQARVRKTARELGVASRRLKKSANVWLSKLRGFSEALLDVANFAERGLSLLPGARTEQNDFLQLVRRSFELPRERDAFMEVVQQLAFDEILGDELFCESSFRPRRRPSAGRPPGARTRHSARFRGFVLDLLIAVEQAGGRLTFSKGYPASGTLWRALTSLSPFLPAKFVGVVPPASRLADICAAWRRERAGEAD